jgi:hypothetical protein
VREGGEPDAVEGAIQGDLAEVVLADLKGHNLDDPLNPVSRQDFDHLKSTSILYLEYQKARSFY